MSRWDGDFSSASWSLAKELARDTPVYYVDYPYTWTDLLRERNKPQVRKRLPALLYGKDPVSVIPGQSPLLKAITPPAMLPANWLSPGKLYRAILAFNNRRLFNVITKALQDDGHESCLLFNSFNPLYAQEVPKGFPAEAFVYQSRDNIRALEPYLRKHGSYLEIECIRSADLSLATSRQLQRDLARLSGKEVHYFPNAADFELFSTAYRDTLPRPAVFREISGPVMTYTGNICHRVDYDLLAATALAFPEATLLLVGPRNHAGHTDIDLDAIPNLKFGGPQRIEDLPAYLAHSDVLLLPFVHNEVTRSIYPLKINEYLASGKPVVSTGFSEDIASFGSVVYLADGAEAFTAAIRTALQDDGPELAAARYAVAAQNTWTDRVALLRKMLENKLPQH